MADRYRDRPFPADDEYARDHSHHAPQQQGESDPLAELARLIGQTDPLSNFGRGQPPQQQAQPSRYEPPAVSEPVASYEDEPVARPSWVQNLAAARQPQAPAYREPSYREEDQYDQHYADEPPHAGGQHDAAPHDHAPHFDHGGYDPLPGQHVAGEDRYDDVLYGRAAHDPARDGHYGAQDGAYDDGTYDPPPYGDEAEQPPKSRRGGTITVVVVLLLAVVGTGAAFAYRTFVGSPRGGEPPIIKADTGPNKVIPPGAGDGSGKQITDRLGEKSAERVVPREEQPVDVNAKTGPRVVFPPLTQNANPPTVASASPTARPTGTGVGNGTLSGGEEPRKIRTLSIRPEANAAAAPAPAQPAARPQPPAAAAPVSLSPQTPPPAVAQPKVAAVNPAAGTGTGTGGGAFVQVSSQKSEADAQASFRALQGKYSGILGSRTASIRKAEVAGKGTFYRAMVGPFGTADEATQFCVNLKSAGGQCVVAR